MANDDRPLSECYVGPCDEQPCPLCGCLMTYVYGDRCTECFTRDRVSREMADRVIAVMNAALALDPAAVQALVDHRVGCNAALADHPEIQVQKVTGQPYHVMDFDTGEVERREPVSYAVGLLGVLNGVVGAIRDPGGELDGWGYVTAQYGDDGKIVRFMRTDGAPQAPVG